MAKIEKRPTGEFSSYYGCYIIVMAALLFLGMIGWTFWSLFAQNRALDLITQEEKTSLPASVLDAAHASSLRDRLAGFGECAKAGRPAELSLSVEEINHIICQAPDSGYGTYRDIVRVTGTEPGGNQLIARLCMPLKRLKFWEGRFRYLAGEGTFKIEIHEEGLDAKLVDVKVPGKAVPRGFVGNLEIWPWVAPYRKQEPLGTILKGIKKAIVTPEGLKLSTTP